MHGSSLITVPARTDAEHFHNATYEALMWALARPGSIQELPRADLATIIGALIDRECHVYAANTSLRSVIAATGASICEPCNADHVFLDLGDQSGLSDLGAVETGSPLYPDHGATVFTAASLGEGQLLRLSGPGIETHHDVRIGGLLPEVWSLRARRCAYPTGFELFFIDGNRLVGLPRSTRVEVL